jgi:hypothetical protein
MVFTSALTTPWEMFSFGWTGTFYHYANSMDVGGVVDNDLLEPFVRLNLGQMTGMQLLSATAGLVGSYQCDRARDDSYTCIGGQFILDARQWNLGVHNEFYYGDALMPLYMLKDAGGHQYGGNLYYGSAFYRKGGAQGHQNIAYNRLEFYFRPHICDFLDIDISAVLHFNEGFSGWQQKASLVFDLDKLRHSRRPSVTERYFMNIL